MDDQHCTFGLWYDFRNPARWPRTFTDFYAQSLEQIRWAESRGIESIWLTEHHFMADGYTPSPFVVAAAIGAQTDTVRIGTNLIVSPLHNPIRLDRGGGHGYSQPAVPAFGRAVRNRPSLLEEGVDLIRRAWSGEPAEFHGKRYDFPALPVTPQPEIAPRLLVGAMAEQAIERVARIGDGYLSTQNAHHEMYLDALERVGRSRDEGRIYAGQWAVVADDPEREWARIGEHALYQINGYIEMGAFGPPDSIPRFGTPQDLVDGGAFTLWDVDTAVTELTALLVSRPQIKDVHFWAQLPGEPVDSGSARIELLTSKVVPQVRAAVAADRQEASA
ncbi:LLM class flavin-dependent oxidoreductase [Rhodococcus chondri]|uniref:LLM class flavin-dependent oxidoreductase n=1 Tax=Rhodococcus chondri TaxID=3065941 RepID=A0ABU7JRL7_9NOCA|nr:LLM class flavin-dependent oxidoreductase [Rhodococcus sp. CC-R104]MEE2032668.1 LLM class flavin-dependent oxidoreductase [Rhodococcus sp. CC-R104]